MQAAAQLMLSCHGLPLSSAFGIAKTRPPRSRVRKKALYQKQSAFCMRSIDFDPLEHAQMAAVRIAVLAALLECEFMIEALGALIMLGNVRA